MSELLADAGNTAVLLHIRRATGCGPEMGLGFRVPGLGFRVQGLGFRVQGLGFRVQGLGFRVQGLGPLYYAPPVDTTKPAQPSGPKTLRSRVCTHA